MQSNYRRTGFEAAREKRANVNESEKEGIVADNIDVRRALMNRVKTGEITLKQAQIELKRIKRGAKASGKITRNQAFNRG